jgi:hypothetical protein
MESTSFTVCKSLFTTPAEPVVLISAPKDNSESAYKSYVGHCSTAMTDLPSNIKTTGRGSFVRRSIGAIVILQPVMQKRRRCLTFLAAALFITSIALLNVLYVLARNYITVRDYYAPRSSNETHRSVAVWPSGFFPPNTYGFHPVNDRGVSLRFTAY